MQEAAAADERAAAAEAEAAAAKQTPFQMACIPRKTFERHNSNRTSQSAHQAVNWLEVHLDLPQQPWTLDRFAGAHFTPAYLSTRKPISSEADFARLAYFQLDDMLKGAELHEKMEHSSEASLLDTTTNSLRRSDLYVLRMAADSHYSSRPVGAVEVRRHSVDVLNDAQCLGQVRNYLMVLKNQCGLRHPLGFLTSFFSWRACWLPEDEEFCQDNGPCQSCFDAHGRAIRSHQPRCLSCTGRIRRALYSSPSELDSESPSHSSSLAQEGSPDSAHPSTLAGDGSPFNASDSSSNSPVELHVSPVYDATNPTDYFNVLRLLTSFLINMSTVGFNDFEVLGSTRLHETLLEESSRWVRRPKKWANYSHLSARKFAALENCPTSVYRAS